MDDIKDIVLEIDILLKNKKINPVLSNIINNQINKIFFDLEELKDFLLNKSNLELNLDEKNMADKLNLEINKRNNIINSFLPLLIQAHFSLEN